MRLLPLQLNSLPYVLVLKKLHGHGNFFQKLVSLSLLLLPFLKTMLPLKPLLSRAISKARTSIMNCDGSSSVSSSSAVSSVSKRFLVAYSWLTLAQDLVLTLTSFGYLAPSTVKTSRQKCNLRRGFHAHGFKEGFLRLAKNYLHHR